MKFFKLFLLFTAGGLLVFLMLGAWNWMQTEQTPTPNITAPDASIVEGYLRANISELSPVPAVLGGTWYVVSVTVNLAEKSGTVIYEDGHIQEQRNFSYTVGAGGEILNLTIN